MTSVLTKHNVRYTQNTNRSLSFCHFARIHVLTLYVYWNSKTHIWLDFECSSSSHHQILKNRMRITNMYTNLLVYELWIHQNIQKIRGLVESTRTTNRQMSTLAPAMHQLRVRVDLLFAAANTWFSIFARVCEYSANSANTSCAIWKMCLKVLKTDFIALSGILALL